MRDILVAFEWYRTEWPVLLEQDHGDRILLNCQRMTLESWQTDVQLSLLRGLAAMRAPGPLWFLQLAGQEVENWPLVGERPIFSEHHSSQFAWMMEASVERRHLRAHYLKVSGLELSKELEKRCVGEL